MRQFCQLPRKFRRDNLLCRQTPRVQLRNAAQLVGLQARSVSQYVLNISLLPSVAQNCSCGLELMASHRRLFVFWIELKLQKECSEQWVSDARERLLMLLCDIASLIR